nr:DnaB-like helicase C-terminal domain-containing protein [Patulibacter sp. SYSU D01012]
MRHVGQLDRPIDDTITALTEATYGSALVHRTPQIRTVADAFDDALRRWENPGEQLGYTLGFHRLDEIMSLAPGTMTVIGARPSVGKSLFAQHVISNVVHKHAVDAVLVSMEMSERELMDRIVAGEARVSARWLARARKPRGDDRRAEWERVLDVGNDEAMRRFGITDTADLAIVDIEALARRYRAQNPDFKLLAVDYLGLIRKADSKQAPVHALDDISRRLKVLAIDMDMAVVVLVQLNRNSETERRPPRISDLRDSGAIEQHADNVLLLHADHPSIGDDTTQPIAASQVIVGKNRSGPPGRIVHLDFDSTVPRFIDQAPAPPVGRAYFENVPLPGGQR